MRLLALGCCFGLVAFAQTFKTERVSLDFDVGSLNEDAAREFLELAHQGTLDLEELLKMQPVPQRIEFRISRRVRMSRAYRNRITLPARRVRERRAPYLHELTHVLMQRFAGGFDPPTWLNEGFASYLEGRVATEKGGYDAHVFTRDGNRSVDVEARNHLQTNYGKQSEPYVGRFGTPPGLDTDRERVAPAFYTLSQSFAKFLVESVGVEAVKEMHRGGLALDRPAGKPLDEWRHEWLRSLER